MNISARGKDDFYMFVERKKHSNVVLSGLTFSQALIKSSSGELKCLI